MTIVDQTAATAVVEWGDSSSFESPGILEPGQRARFAARGVRNVDDGWNLLRDIFLFATLECVAAARYPAPWECVAAARYPAP